jgi:hypothetical protein
MFVRYPSEFHSIAVEAVKSNLDNINDSVDEAEARIRDLPCFKDFVKMMVRDAIRHLIHDIRHSMNTQAKKEAGGYAQPRSIKIEESDGIRAAHVSMLDYFINGKRLGSLVKEELLELAESEKENGRGRYINAYVLGEINKRLKPGQKVEEVLTERQVQRLFERAKRSVA